MYILSFILEERIPHVLLIVYFIALAFIVKSPLVWLKCYLIGCFSQRAAAYQRQFDILVILSRLMEKTKAIQFQ